MYARKQSQTQAQTNKHNEVIMEHEYNGNAFNRPGLESSLTSPCDRFQSVPAFSFSYQNVRDMSRLLEIVSENYGKNIFIEFIGTLRSDGQSWCPDCRRADPIVKCALRELPEDAVFIFTEVGGRVMWRNPSNPFRTNKAFRLRFIPTIVRFGSDERLVGSDVESVDNIVKMFKGIQ
ncbi:hypothetical protein FBUS_03510 [Fasciolopsis buskii]|uniref:Thioredoxin domain-containing protein 17 n=1 Tax=Fasciolopsis buskii TaxID=27845 RepID=A0A8E0S2B6_9TREM|nr:hypothetical protein FBUS_03510 [Fasciolopsis buski]